MKVVWTPLAERRLREAISHLEGERPSAADRWLDALDERVGLLAKFPKTGRPVPEIGRPVVRQLLLAPYRLVYRIDPTRVVVLTVRHQRRAWDAHELDLYSLPYILR